MVRNLGNLKAVRPFLGRYKEIHITYDVNTLGVEADGLLSEGFWENIIVQYDINSPEDYATGLFDTLKTLFPGMYITLAPTTLVETEGYLIDDSREKETMSETT